MYHNRGYISHLGSVLPPADSVYQSAFNMAFPQILAWCTAAAAALTVVLIVKYFRG
jgi:hypothetical protein